MTLFCDKPSESIDPSMHRNRHEVFAMPKLALGILTALLLAATSPVVMGDDAGWKMPNLNPFPTSGQPPTSARRAPPPTSGWKMPKLVPQAKAQPKGRPSQPTTWNRMTNGPQNLFS